MPLDITVEAQGPVIIASVAGEKVFAAYSPSPSQGTVALYCRDRCAFDNVSIQENDSASVVAITEPAAYSVMPSTTFSVGAVVLNKPEDAQVAFELLGQPNACTAASEAGHPGLFTASCTAPTGGVFQLRATASDQFGVLDSQTVDTVGIGENYVTIGDSQTVGLDDNKASDGISQNEWMVSSLGYQAVLADELGAFSPPVIIHKGATPGDTSFNTLGDRLGSILERHPDGSHVYLLIGINDAGGTTFTSSGLDCVGAACNGTYKGNVQAIIDQLAAQGLNVTVGLVAPRFGDPSSPPYTDPASHERNLLIRDGYNEVIRNQLHDRQVGADLYNFFLGGENRFYLYATNLHPNALGYYIISYLIRNSITGEVELPFFVKDFCLRLTTGGACESPFLYKQNLLEVGNRYYVDQSFTLASIPEALVDGRWIMTDDSDRDASNADYLSFDISEPSDLYVAYDAGAQSLPPWLDPSTSNFEPSGLHVDTTNTAAPVMSLYRMANVSGVITLGGANASATGANANFVAIVVPLQ